MLVRNIGKNLLRSGAPFGTTAARPVASVVQSLLHGSEQAKKEGAVTVEQHSRLVGRGKYVHSFEVHHVKPDCVEEYKKAAEQFYPAIASDSSFHVKLTGSWEVTVGQLDTFVHILEYENYSGYDKSTKMIRESKHNDTFKTLLPYITSRTSQLNQEFAFCPSSPPHTQGGVFELRTYQLQPGRLLEWESTWSKGIEARRQFVQPVGAWFSQVGRLHEVHHLWQYPDLQSRKDTREKAWQVDGWSETVHKTAHLAKWMDAKILNPLPFSPLK